MQRRLGFLLIIGAVVSLAVASAAWACGVLATLTVAPKKVTAGQTLTATGKNYGQVSAGNSEVTIRWKSRRGTALATAIPDPRGNISTTFRVPANATRGTYVVMATQTTSSGAPKSGTPGRTTVRVKGGGGGGAGAAWSSSEPTGPQGSTASVPLDAGGSSSPGLPTLLGVLLSFGLLGTGLALVGRGRARAPHRRPLGA